MQTKTTSSPMLARAEDSVAGKPSRTVGEGSSLPPDADPDDVVDEILALLSEERYPSARRLAARARTRFPDYPRIRDVWTIFDTQGKATPGPEASEPPREEEFEWLRHPPESARGKWVALLGNEMIDAAETLMELEKSLRVKNLPRPALVHYVD